MSEQEETPKPPFVIDYTQYTCQECGKQGVCEDGFDVFVALLCQPCYDRILKEYIAAVSRKE